MDDPLSSVEIDTTETAPAADDDRQTLQAADDARPLDEGSASGGQPSVAGHAMDSRPQSMVQRIQHEPSPNYVEGNPGPYVRTCP